MVIEPNYIETPLETTEVQGTSQITPQTNTPATPTSDSNIVPTGGGSVLAGGAFQSPNYSVGVAGWKIDSNGDVEFGSGKFRGSITGATGTFSGTITAATGTIGGWSINATSIYTGTEDHSGYTANAGDITIYSDGADASIHGKSFYIDTTGKLTCTDIVATGTINAEGGYLASGVYIDTVNGLLCESGGINVGTSGHIRGGQTDYATGAGFFLGYSGGAYKFSVGDPTGKYINWTGTDFVVNGFVISSKGAFGGDGSDGALTISSGTTTLDAGAASVYIKNYTSISITGTTGKLAFSNPASGGTVIIIKSQGNQVLTSTIATGCIDVSGMGAAGGAATSGTTNGNDGTGNNDYLIKTTGGGKGVNPTPGIAGVLHSLSLASYNIYGTRYYFTIIGAGGASGSSNGADGGVNGAGGRGGGALILECNGDMNFPATAYINCGGLAGGAATAGSSDWRKAGGAGGGGGSFLGLYNTVTSVAGTVTVTGGTGVAFAGSANNSYSGGGGGSYTAGSAGQTNGNGGNGGNGLSKWQQNNLYA